MKKQWRIWKYCWHKCAEVVDIEKIRPQKEKVRCPYCGYPVNAMQSTGARCEGIFFKCKNKNCRKEFELRI